jgi:Protein of unknown function (DUF3224)
MNGKNKTISAVLLASVFLLTLAPAALTATASSGTSASTIKVHGIWTLTSFNSTVLKTVHHVQYGAGVGVGFITGGIHGSSVGEYLTEYYEKTGIILFTGQIQCTCTIQGHHGQLWISFFHGIDHNANNPNGKTTAEYVIVGASGGLAGTTGHGPMVTTTSSDDMNFTMWITPGWTS